MLPNITTVNFQGLSVHALPMKKTWYSLHVSNRSYAFELANVNYLMVYIFLKIDKPLLCHKPQLSLLTPMMLLKTNTL